MSEQATIIVLPSSGVLGGCRVYLAITCAPSRLIAIVALRNVVMTGRFLLYPKFEATEAGEVTNLVRAVLLVSDPTNPMPPACQHEQLTSPNLDERKSLNESSAG